ncbi:MAG: PF20097 family protein [Oscillibacter sp.]|nr:PF20097 family protein [Dysosmobacter sp.]MDD6408749.1 PF20097 family protein [Oscillibacter sp.]MDY3866509.1 PF20097 family protein [Dysosmobacter sp.]
MPFWKKSEDPWDIDLSKRRPAPKLAEKAPGLVDTIREEWDAMQKERQEKRKKLELPPEKCPWCGKDMEQGFLMGSRGVFWYRGIPAGKALWLSPGRENIMRVDTEGDILHYHTAWYCPACKKMTIDASDLQTEAEKNQMAFPTGAENMTEQSDEIKEGE